MPQASRVRKYFSLRPFSLCSSFYLPYLHNLAVVPRHAGKIRRKNKERLNPGAWSHSSSHPSDGRQEEKEPCPCKRGWVVRCTLICPVLNCGLSSRLLGMGLEQDSEVAVTLYLEVGPGTLAFLSDTLLKQDLGPRFC